MHLVADPDRIPLAPGEEAVVALAVTNLSNLIDRYRVEPFGVDPQWVTPAPNELVLFPGETGTFEVLVALPRQFPGGRRELVLSVRSDNDAGEFALATVAVEVPSHVVLRLRAEPVFVTAGRRATFDLVLANDGNLVADTEVTGLDPEAMATFTPERQVASVGPGQRTVVRVEVSAPRPLFGMPRPRVLQFRAAAQPWDPAVPAPTVEGVATFLQRPLIGRGLVSLLGLMLAAAVFAVVLTNAFGTVARQAAVDADVLDAALASRPQAGQFVALQKNAMTGTVTLVGGAPLAGVQVEAFDAADPVAPIGSAATDEQGVYTLVRLAAGRYLLRYSGAGFTTVWYREGASVADAEPVTVRAGETQPPLAPVVLTGLPGTVQGQLDGADVRGATVTLLRPGEIEEGVDAVVGSVEVGADGTFAFDDVPSPATYQLVVEQPGATTQVRDVVLGPAEDLEGLDIVLQGGGGLVAGLVVTGGVPLGGATLALTDGTVTYTTSSLTTPGSVGQFSLGGLPVPGRYTLTATRPGYATAAQTVLLGQDGAPTTTSGVVVDLAAATGSLGGTVRGVDGQPLGGVVVTARGGDVVATTVSVSEGAGVGTYLLDDLPAPATYTLTFTRPDLVTQSRLEDLDATRGRTDVGNADVTMVRATSTIRGQVLDATGRPVAGASVTVTDGTTTRRARSADEPLGQFELTGLPPATYTASAELPGTSAAVVVVTTLAGQTSNPVVLQLREAASVYGTVLRRDGSSAEGLVVRLYVAEQFPVTAQATVTTGSDGGYRFPAVPAPVDYIVAVFEGPGTVEVLAARSVQSIPSQPVEVPTLVVAS